MLSAWRAFSGSTSRASSIERGARLEPRLVIVISQAKGNTGKSAAVARLRVKRGKSYSNEAGWKKGST
jgi:hypothetical protein